MKDGNTAVCFISQLLFYIRVNKWYINVLLTITESLMVVYANASKWHRMLLLYPGLTYPGDHVFDHYLS